VRQLPCNSQLDAALRDQRLSARMQIMIVFYGYTYCDAYYMVVTCTVKIIKMWGEVTIRQGRREWGGRPWSTVILKVVWYGKVPKIGCD
jgi:hypothetical protein